MRIDTDHRHLDEASQDILSTLAEQVGLDVWMVSRREGDELRVVATAGTGLEIERGLAIPWADSVCARVATGEGPGAAPDLATVPAYASAPVVGALGLGAYIGAPLVVEGETVGSLCGLSRTSQPSELVDRLPLVELCARLLGRLWASERAATTDRLTGLANRRAWDEALEREERRCRRFDLAAAVLAVDLDRFKAVNDRHGHAAGDEHLRRAGTAIAEAVRAHDLVARWGGDEFCVLAVECDELTAERLGHRVRRRLATAGVPASAAIAMRRGGGLECALESALAGVQGKKRLGARAESAHPTSPGAQAAEQR
ncbi:MAG: sensor domain-containing diguanylate cyclase [Thermoleophilaceae bacterium]|jgi:diguanylate cyclase (GGDEF)-like protein|nr:sensor domain-containing diguanylate cyclase [Thermoleophilaceae bacterium]